MRSVAGTAVSLGNRSMDYPLGKFLFAVLVTGVTKRTFMVAQQPFVLGHVWVMTDTAL